MSDKPTGEWTYTDFYDLSLEEAQEMSNKVNAALALKVSSYWKCREELEDMEQQMIVERDLKRDLETQLAAERERSKSWEQDALRYAQDTSHCKSQLAAERETKEKAIEAWGNRNLKLVEQLAAEREKVQTLTDALTTIAQWDAYAREVMAKVKK